MNPSITLLRVAVLAVAMVPATGLAGDHPPSTGGEPALTPKLEPTASWAVDGFPRDRVASWHLPPIDPKRIYEVQQRNARDIGLPIQIGINRSVVEPEQALAWVGVPGGSVARIEVTSPDALGMRVGLDVSRLPASVELRFAGDIAPGRVTQLTAAKARTLLAHGLYWSPITDGDTQVIELFAPAGTSLVGAMIATREVSHLLTNAAERFSLAKTIGTSGPCNIDTKCREVELGQDFVNAKNSVALTMFTQSGTFACTATLLNDTDPETQIPYLWTTRFCPGTQDAANTLSTYWGFEATACGSGVAAEHVVLDGGADILFSDELREPDGMATDAALLRLRKAPPAGAYYSGWNATPLARGDSVLAIQHPFADLKKSSMGQMRFTSTYLYMVGWTSGTAVWDDLGSGLFTLGDGYQLRGGLVNSDASCANSGDLSNNENLSHFSRFDAAWNLAQPYLDPVLAGPRPTRNYTGAWFSADEPGWGLTAYQYAGPANNLFVMFFIYDQTGKAQWFEMDATWTATDVRSGNLLQSTAGPWGPSYNPANRSFSVAGTATLTFTSATTANVSFTVNGATRNISLQKL